MRLLKASTIEFEEFNPDQIPPYAILSHTWETQEVLFSDILQNTGETKSSWNKVKSCCLQTIADGLEYVWVDSCCIDKSSSAELSETINSMYSYYQKAEICYAYLFDVPGGDKTQKLDSALARCRWFTRGFTLQELLAPLEVIFFAQDWTDIGKKSALSATISRITHIEEDILMHRKSLQSASIARRMSWAAWRQTSRPEDTAYCLMGIFDVNMPMLYGEGEKAFIRLQEEIMKHSDDHTIFAWSDSTIPQDTYHGLLASSPRQFAGCHNIVPYEDFEQRQPYTMTNEVSKSNYLSNIWGMLFTWPVLIALVQKTRAFSEFS